MHIQITCFKVVLLISTMVSNKYATCTHDLGTSELVWVKVCLVIRFWFIVNTYNRELTYVNVYFKKYHITLLFCAAFPVDMFMKIWCFFYSTQLLLFIFLSVLNFSFCWGLFFSFFFLLIMYECFVTITCTCKKWNKDSYKQQQQKKIRISVVFF